MEDYKNPKENVPWSMEFAVPGKNLQLLKKNVARVKRLFNVNVVFSTSFKRGDVDMQWINFMGDGNATAEEMKNARTYIISMTNPEACISVNNFPPSLFHSSVDEVEMSTFAFLTLKNKSVQINGSEFAVVLAQSMLENIQQEDVTDEKCLRVDISGESQNVSHPTSLSCGMGCTTQSTPSFPSPSDISLHSPSPESLTYVKRVVDTNSEQAYLPIISASSYASHENDYFHVKNMCKKGDLSYNNNTGNAPSSSSITGGQYEYLKHVGLSHHFGMDVIEEGLKRCDMHDVIKPAEFLNILKYIRHSHEMSSFTTNTVDGATSSNSGTTEAKASSSSNSPRSSPHTSSSVACAVGQKNVIVIDSDLEDNGEDVDEGMEAIVISSDEDTKKGTASSQPWQPKNKKKARKKKIKGESFQPVENLPHPQSLPTPKINSQGENKTKCPNPTAGGFSMGQASSSSQRPAPTIPPLLCSTRQQQKPSASAQPKKLRYIVIDGNNVAMAHGGGKVYSVKGIQICAEYFRSRGHKVTAFVPESRRYMSNQTPITGKSLLEKMNQDGYLKFTPARRITTGRVIASYDDRFILNLAEAEAGIVVSNDQYRDLLYSKPSYKEIIETRLLQFTFVEDHFMPPDDPLGRDGPTLEEFLCMPFQPAARSDDVVLPEAKRFLSPARSRTAAEVPQIEKQAPAPKYQGWQEQKAWLEEKQKEKSKKVRALVRDEDRKRMVYKGDVVDFPHLPATAVPQIEKTPAPKYQGWQEQKAWLEEKQKKKSKNIGALVGDEDSGRVVYNEDVVDFPLLPAARRTEKQTRDLFEQLSQMFPGRELHERLRAILKNHPDEKDISRLSNYVLNALSF